MLKLSFFLLFIHTFLLSNIDINKKAITISLSSTLPLSQIVANNFNEHDIYIYKTTTTKNSYYVIYAVNIKKERQKTVLKSIQKKYKDAYISSDTRIKKLASINFDKNIFIKSDKKSFQNKNLTYRDKSIDINKRSLFVTDVKNKKELFVFLKKYKEYNIFVENLKIRSLSNHDRCCAIYIVNIHTEEFDDVFKLMKRSYTHVKEEETTFLKYKHERYPFNTLVKRY